MQRTDSPVLFRNKENCCGCTACYAICPRNAITMRTDAEGFLYPYIDEGKCVKCHQCEQVCPFKQRRSPYKDES